MHKIVSTVAHLKLKIWWPFLVSLWHINVLISLCGLWCRMNAFSWQGWNSFRRGRLMWQLAGVEKVGCYFNLYFKTPASNIRQHANFFANFGLCFSVLHFWQQFLLLYFMLYNKDLWDKADKLHLRFKKNLFLVFHTGLSGFFSGCSPQKCSASYFPARPDTK